jgi:hypothetical protein
MEAGAGSLCVGSVLFSSAGKLCAGACAFARALHSAKTNKTAHPATLIMPANVSNRKWCRYPTMATACGRDF